MDVLNMFTKSTVTFTPALTSHTDMNLLNLWDL